MGVSLIEKMDMWNAKYTSDDRCMVHMSLDNMWKHQHTQVMWQTHGLLIICERPTNPSDA